LIFGLDRKSKGGERAKRALLHIGTHKTGTTSIQAFLADNWRNFYSAGIYIPNAGRLHISGDQYSPGHHGLPKTLNEGSTEVLEELRRELSPDDRRHVLISSEGFYALLSSPGKLAAVRDVLAELGYETFALVYFRDHAPFASSSYVEVCKHGQVLTFSDFMAEVIEYGQLHHGTPYALYFEYAKATMELASVFGTANIVVRKYQEGAQSVALVEDFVRSVQAVLQGRFDAPLDFKSHALNQRSAFFDIAKRFETISGDRGVLDEEDPRFQRACNVMLFDEAVRLRERFAQDARQMAQMARVQLDQAPLDEADPRWAEARWQRAILDKLINAL
jgi:hypothetical protein